jgi:hypothetical protein
MSKNTFFRVYNDSSQAERRAILRNEREVGTYHAFAAGEAGVVGGRFAARERSAVTGATPAPQYPTLPVNSPWATEPVGQERPLGFSVDEMIPAGEPHEVTASLGEANLDAAGQLLPEAVEQASPSSGAGSGVIQPSPPFETAPLLSRKRRKRQR